MRRLPLVVLVGVAAMSVAMACGPSAPPEMPGPDPDSLAAAQAREDSIRRAQEEAERLRREQDEAERLRRQREADSLAALGRTTEEVRSMLASMINFDYDRSNIRPGDAAILDEKVRILQANPDLRIRIAGHCDERGSDEYNLALGNRRATSAKQYLVSHGIDAGRIETMSYGEERPIAMGSTEDAWAQNRRDEFEIIAGGNMLMRP